MAYWASRVVATSNSFPYILPKVPRLPFKIIPISRTFLSPSSNTPTLLSATRIRISMVKQKPVSVDVLDESPRPMAGLHDTAPPPFLSKTFDMVEDPETDNVVSWSLARNSFIVWEPEQLAAALFPRLFKHGNFSSFVRQLHTYGFRKVDPDRWEFANERFLGGQKHLLKDIKKRRNLAVGQSSHKLNEVESLKRDYGVLIGEIARLKQQQQSNRAQLLAMEEHIKGTERRQLQQTRALLEGVVKHPSFIQQALQQIQMEQQQQQQLSIVGQKRRLTTNPDSENLEADGVLVGTETDIEKLISMMGSLEEEGVMGFHDSKNPGTDISNQLLLEVFLNDEGLFSGNIIGELGDEPGTEG